MQQVSCSHASADAGPRTFLRVETAILFFNSLASSLGERPYGCARVKQTNNNIVTEEEKLAVCNSLGTSHIIVLSPSCSFQ
jgi:hypothetical protein